MWLVFCYGVLVFVFVVFVGCGQCEDGGVGQVQVVFVKLFVSVVVEFVVVCFGVLQVVLDELKVLLVEVLVEICVQLSENCDVLECWMCV